jgi:hypothetical protein
MPSSIPDEYRDNADESDRGSLPQSRTRKHTLIDALEKNTKKNKYYYSRSNHEFCINVFV